MVAVVAEAQANWYRLANAMAILANWYWIARGGAKRIRIVVPTIFSAVFPVTTDNLGIANPPRPKRTI
jgi:hypothetical protein